MTAPRVSVVIPTFNAAATLPEALDSVRAQGVAVEVFVVDDGSTDATAELLAAYRDVTVIRQSNQGPAAARNRGVERATGEYVAFLDADDLWLPGRLATQIALLDARPEVAVAIGYTQFRGFDPASGTWQDVAAPHLLFALGAALVRRSLFDRYGSFDESLGASEDVDWFLRLRDAGERIEITRDTVLVYRRNGLNMTKGRDLRDLQFIEVLKRSLDRRRAGGSR